MSGARASRDNNDIRIVLSYLKQGLPFAEDNSSIRNIATSTIADEVEKIEQKDVIYLQFKT